MLDPGEREALTKGFRIIRLTWAALLFSLLVYVLICHVGGEEIRAAVSPDFPRELLRNILYFIAVAELIIAYFLRKFILKPTVSRPQSSFIQHEQDGGIGVVVSKYMVAVLVSLAISESIGIYGLVLYLLGDELQTLYIFVAVSALAMFYFRPKMEELEQLAVAMRHHSTSSHLA